MTEAGRVGGGDGRALGGWVGYIGVRWGGVGWGGVQGEEKAGQKKSGTAR